MTSNNVAESESSEQSESQPSKAVDDLLIDELVGRAQANSLQLTGERGLQQLTNWLLESALESEITGHLGYDSPIRPGRTAATAATAPAPRLC
ncbi:transposase [Streptomyces sp. NBC_00191]|uniref:transposase n=1 Tax=Streptomyces sp. NBC_00191 TaxID=2975674 RepID=UPI003870B1EE